MKINKQINHKKLWLDSMTGMSMGFFSTLIIGSLIGIFGLYSSSNIFLDAKKIITAITPFAIGVGIGIKAKSSPLQIFALAIATTLVANSLIKTKFLLGHIVMDDVKIGFDISFSTPGDVLAAWLAGVFMLYVFNVFIWESPFDFVLLPLVGIALGIVNSLWLTYLVSLVTASIEFIISKTANQNITWAIVLAPVIGVLMGLALSLPTSSAAMAIAIKLHGDAAIAAIAGTAAQMISFGVMTYWSSRSLTKTIAVSFGTSMLHMANYSRKPILLLIPSIASAISALVAVASFAGTLPFEPGKPTSGMGTAVLYGQIFTLKENGWANHFAWLNVIFIQLLLPLAITLPLLYLFDKKSLIRKDWLQLWTNTQQNTLARQVK